MGGVTWRLVDGPEGRLVPKAVWPRERDEDGAWCDDRLEDGHHQEGEEDE